MNMEQKKKVRSIILILILAALIIGAVVNLSIEPADYYKSLEARIGDGEKLLEEARIGNDKGEYTQTAVDTFAAELQKARDIVAEHAMKHSQIKAYYADFKDTVKDFKKAKNTQPLSEAAVESTVPETQMPTEETVPPTETQPTTEPSQETESPVPEETKRPEPTETRPKATEPAETVPETTESKTPYCYVEIRCDTIVDTSKLTNQAVAPYVPASGVILGRMKVELYEGETAFEVLKRVTREENIQLEFRSDAAYSGGAYIEGINHIYEFDAGSGSGWMYKVNGWFPNYGCANYFLESGDEMVWCYTCNIGKDVGDQYYDDHPDANP